MKSFISRLLKKAKSLELPRPSGRGFESGQSQRALARKSASAEWVCTGGASAFGGETHLHFSWILFHELKLVAIASLLNSQLAR
ncbi:MAG TPA: hypothetical protein VGR15_11335 [Bacteroidota bacterium]|jgi:hypothetical protein|nr:hypothetical protein [Bacteroidota bacterium]